MWTETKSQWQNLPPPFQVAEAPIEVKFVGPITRPVSTTMDIRWTYLTGRSLIRGPTTYGPMGIDRNPFSSMFRIFNDEHH